MDLQQLRYFVAVADKESIRAGAASVGVTQPTISQALHGLEREFRTRLFVRAGRGMVLTSAGHALLGPARRILRAAAAARDSLISGDGGYSGRLDVSVSLGAMSGIVPDLLARFLRKNPNVILNVRNLATDADLVAALQDRHTDVAFSRTPILMNFESAGTVSNLVIQEIGEVEILYVEPPSTENDGKDSAVAVPWEGRGQSRRIIAPSSNYVDSVFNGKSAVVRTPDLPPVVATRRETRLAMVAAGIGSSYILDALAPIAKYHKARSLPLAPRLLHKISMVYEEDETSGVVSGFVSFVRGEVDRIDRNAEAAGEIVESR